MVLFVCSLTHYHKQHLTPSPPVLRIFPGLGTLISKRSILSLSESQSSSSSTASSATYVIFVSLMNIIFRFSVRFKFSLLDSALILTSTCIMLSVLLCNTTFITVSAFKLSIAGLAFSTVSHIGVSFSAWLLFDRSC